MDINQQLATELGIQLWQAEAVVRLIDEGNTIPFIARYRKEAHGALNDEVLRHLDERLAYLRSLDERRQSVISSIREQGKLTEGLEKKILEAKTLVEVEDLYLPYRPKRRTRATIAKERGLEPLAEVLLAQESKDPPETLAAPFVSEEKEVPGVTDALQGASDIIAEALSDRADFREYIRQTFMKEGIITSEVRRGEENPESVYAGYFHYQEKIAGIQGHRVLAINRAEKEKVVTVSIEAPRDQILAWMYAQILKNGRKTPAATDTFLKTAAEDSYDRLIAPAVEREVRSSLAGEAEDGAIDVFGKNLEKLLMQPPITGETVLGWDPAFRTGCKLAVVDPTGRVLDTAVVFPTAPTNDAKIAAAKKKVTELIRKYHVTLISIGNGTASRESEQFVAELLKEIPEKVSYAIVSEAGASVYSASSLATEEFPEFDVGQRSAASIARRLQDPLSELVKIDPKSIGVGQYQHDLNQKKLDQELGGVVEECVNSVGVDLNTASFPLLTYVSGISKKTAKSIVSYREENGAFKDRRTLLKVAGLGPKAFEQCAGFLRIRGAANALDSSAVHPESYDAAKKLLAHYGYTLEDVAAGRIHDLKKQLTSGNGGTLKELSAKFGVGEMTLSDIADELEKPGRDPRSDLPKPILRSDVLKMEDLKPGMILKGTVRNVIDFGAFVDIGVHQDGLVHISEMKENGFVKHPLDVVSIGDIVDVKVLSVDLARKRISLSMKLGQQAAAGGNAGKNAGAGREKDNPRREKSGTNRSAAGKESRAKGMDQKSGKRKVDPNTGLDLSALLSKWH